jgi:hypothetical protein
VSKDPISLKATEISQRKCLALNRKCLQHQQSEESVPGSNSERGIQEKVLVSAVTNQIGENR